MPSESTQPPGTARGRRPGQAGTREVIVRAARELFAERGVAGTTLRAIAERAGVNASLLIHFYGSKSGLLEAAVDWPFDIDEARRMIMVGSLDDVGEHLVRLFVEVWDGAGAGHPILLLLRVCGTDDGAARLMAELLDYRLLNPLWPALIDRYGPVAAVDQTAERGSLIASQLLGVALTRYVLRQPPICAMPPSRIAAIVGPSLQRLMTACLPQ